MLHNGASKQDIKNYLTNVEDNDIGMSAGKKAIDLCVEMIYKIKL